MFDSKLKKEIIEKVRQGHEKVEQLQKLEAANPRLKADDLLHINAYAKLWKELEMIDGEVKFLMLETKYYPLSGIDSGTMSALLPFDFFSEENKMVYDKTISDETIEKYLDMEYMKLHEDMKGRLRMLRPLISTFEIDANTRLLYRQIARCFTYGMFESCCILCSTVVGGDCSKFASEEDAFRAIENLHKFIYKFPKLV
jgi:hypothetical protein